MAVVSSCTIGNVKIGEGRLALIAGPCVAESEALCQEIAGTLADLCRKLEVGFVFKASYDKANRSSGDSYRGPGLETGLQWLTGVREQLGVPVVSDIHDISQVQPAAETLDCLQIPAFLCRQTDLLLAAGRSGKPVNVKKGQFMAPWDMEQAVQKILSTGNRQVLLTERGTSFGYNRLITDFRGIPQMQQFAPVVFDATHSVQEPGGLGTTSGGKRKYAPLLASAAMAAGADALFIETHPEPDKALSDGPNTLRLSDMEGVLARCVEIFRAVH